MSAHYIDMGQADATLLEFSCGAVLIDAGAQYKRGNNSYNVSQTKRLTDYLGDFFNARPDLNNTLNAIYITHNHIDHTHALREVVETFTVLNYIGTGLDTSFNDATKDPKWVREQTTINSELVTSNDFSESNFPQGFSTAITDPIDCGETNPDIRILSGKLDTNPGWRQDEYENENNHSLVIRVDFGNSSFLFTGDLEHDGIDHLLETYSNALSMLDVDIYQVGHHGSHNATTVKLLDAMTPDLAVISAGKWDHGKPDIPFTTYAYGHPRFHIVDLLALSITETRPSKKVKVFRSAKKAQTYSVEDSIYSTSWDGTIRINATYDGKFRVTTEN